eukprot:6491931-Amphidinium_carterae.1
MKTISLAPHIKNIGDLRLLALPWSRSLPRIYNLKECRMVPSLQQLDSLSLQQGSLNRERQIHTTLVKCLQVWIELSLIRGLQRQIPEFQGALCQCTEVPPQWKL